MNLRYISLHMGFDSGYSETIRKKFNLHSRFVSNFLSVQIRKLKFKTDGSFNIIGVSPSLNIRHVCRIVGDDALQARVTFNKESYDQMEDTKQYEYYLRLLEDGYKICSQYKEIPMQYLLDLHQRFRENGYKNEWLHKKKKFKEQGIEVKLECSFTSIDFKLQITVNNIIDKEQLITGTIIRTLPDEVYFEKEFKDILIEKKNLIVTDFYDRPRVKLLLTDIFNKHFRFELQGDGLEYMLSATSFS